MSGWPTAKLGDLVGSFQNGCGVRQSSSGKPTVVLRLADVNSTSGAISETDLREVRLSESEREKYELAPGDLLAVRVNGSRDIAGRAVVYSGPGGYAYCDHFIRVRPGPQVDSSFLGYALRSHSIREQVSRGLVSSAGQHTISQGTLAEIELPLPPLATQRRIVAKLDELLAHSRAARNQLEAVPALVETYRQSVLAAALRGDLTADWRKRNPTAEPASELVERIRIERRKKWEDGELAKIKAKGRPPKDDRWKARYVEPERVDARGLPELPESWCWASLDQLLHSLRNGIGVKPDEEEGLPILRISAVRPMALDLEDVRFLAPRSEFDAYALREGDLLFTRYNGNADLVGSCAVVNRITRTVVYPDKLIRARVVAPHVLPQYLAMAASTGATRAFIATKSKSAAGQVGVSGADLKRAPVPLAPLEEQRALVACSELLEGGTDVLEAGDVACSRLAELERSLLAKAFSGHLVR